MGALPTEIVTPRLVIRRWRPVDAPALGVAVRASIEHLRPWMAWIPSEPLTDEERAELIRSWDDDAAGGGDGIYGILRDDAIVGGCGLHHRQGPDTLEIGYWIHVDHVRRGYATEVARALTTAAFTVDGIDRIEIHHDRANLASGRVPATLGFVRGEERPDEIAAPGEEGVDCTWYVERSSWTAAD